MKALALGLLALITVIGSQSSYAQGIAGNYYTPFTQIPNSDEFRPESLRMINEDGSYEVRTIHNGAQEIYVGTYQVDGSRVTFKKGTYKAICPNVLNSDEGEFTANFRRTPNELMLSQDSETFSFPVATQAEIQKILSLPVCGSGTN
ncbi:MAG: hypothetical protein AB7G93_08660 [Bdellovibrionales bacterium]